MEKIKEKYFYPMAVSAIYGKKDANEDIILRWDKFDLLEEKEKGILISNNVPVTIKKIADKFNLPPISIENISRLVREVYFKNVIKSNLSHELIRRIPILTVENAQEIYKILNDEIFTLQLQTREDIEVEKKKATFIQMKLSDALLQYPKVGEQSVGSEQIKLRYFPMPVRPSIKNWITDFHDGMGAGKHSPMDRGNFLFHSENGKKLNSADRQKLGTILRSLDEQTLLTIDGHAQIIIFENAENTQNESNVNAEKQGQVMPSNLDSRLRGNDNNMDVMKVTPSAGNAQTSLPSGHLSSSEERMTMNKILDRRNQIQQERNTHDVFGDLAPTPKNENIQDKQLNNKVQDFFAKPAVEKTMPDNYFSIPQSKPPIGSEEFHIANTDNARAESGLKMDQSNAVEAPKSGKILDSLPTGQAGRFHQPRVDEQSFLRVEAGGNDNNKEGLDRDLMSDEDLFNMLREKKIKQDAAKLNSSAGNFKFSSPQKLPAEQEKQPAKTLVQQPLRQQAAPSKQNNFSIKPSSQIQKSPYHISPSDYEYGKKTEAKNEEIPKIQKNIVDLKN
ncbi:MAG: hypothetical protein US57_C0004G0025 [Candidatus Moranbacteria bacterium GW2011_GWC2_37_73]|nr:MAG: hypothetical protein UR95_C0002G0075 [Parcubacteria group bacterium GW2011_GWC1_36_108]KKQ01082.1 MAG: hypothetical protein US09_C0003G0082 [Candidatus Moranbacteria bacterium GW2011_GWD1_36_198]KKQ02484.1 MAG: hypothetical protein US10_C0001G0082 [Candidatus Moranbacteria bacterium GW2011_GWD2_36_198]KKQ40142.1 MAG: hypothetical protein US57_C0004G0025 [Candidatus Moranbacteria bacterium GW2011_GWC2_37_73]HAS00238.1 hypothetical protein [Candidatus Moranbacteria bacterium]